MKRSHIALTGMVVLLLAVVGVVAGLRWWERDRVEQTILEYDSALSEALKRLDPEVLGETVGERERVRVTQYITMLWGDGVYLESDLIDSELLSVQSEDPTITATFRETWRYVERDRATSEARGGPTTRTQTLVYTLVSNEAGELEVYLSEVVDGGGIP